MLRTIILNALFIVAGCASAIASEAIYRIALIVIVLLLRAWWARATVKDAFDKRTVVRNELIRLGSRNARCRIAPSHISRENE